MTNYLNLNVSLLGGSSHLVVNTHGDHKSPKDRVVGPLPNGGFMA